MGGLNDFSSNKILKQKIASPPVSPQAPPYFFTWGGLLFFQMGGPWGALRLDGGAQLWSPREPPIGEALTRVCFTLPYLPYLQALRILIVLRPSSVRPHLKAHLNPHLKAPDHRVVVHLAPLLCTPVDIGVSFH